MWQKALQLNGGGTNGIPSLDFSIFRNSNGMYITLGNTKKVSVTYSWSGSNNTTYQNNLVINGVKEDGTEVNVHTSITSQYAYSYTIELDVSAYEKLKLYSNLNYLQPTIGTITVIE